MEFIYGIGLALLISAILMSKVLLEHWGGTVIERKTEKVPVRRGNKTYYTDTDFVILKLINGKTKKIRAMPDWQTGTRLIKRRGAFQVSVVPS